MKFHPDFIVIDTEGQPILREIAIVDHQGKLIYEAWADNHPNNPKISPKTKPLKTIITDFLNFAHSKTIICHYARHDIDVLRNSFRAVGIPTPHLVFECSFELAQQHLPELGSHSLEALSQHLNLKLDGKIFNHDSAHRAKYDALFTYQLYRRMVNEFLKVRLKKRPNPFGSSRVDTPFQDHVDFRSIFQNEFERLKSIIIDIKQDPNHQSKGAVVIGEPGAGKTHLMMRLAKDLLQTNRLLFIRQPNNKDTVLFHTYSRILESLIQNVPGSDRTQLEHLLANSFAKIIKTEDYYSTAKIQKDEKILQVIEDGNLNLFTELGQEETKTKREYWQHIEKRASDWWLRNFSSAGYAPQILKGIIRFCGYTDFNRRQIITQWLALNDLSSEELNKVGLESWGEDWSREEISLAALEVLSKLSLLDEPLIIIFDQLEGLGLKANEPLLQSFGESIKEIFTHVPNSLIILNLFPDRWQQFQHVFDGSIVDRVSQSQIFLSKPANQQMIQLLNLKLQTAEVSISELFEPDEIQTILEQVSIRATLNTAADYYRYKIEGISLPKRLSSISNTSTVEPEVEQQIQQLTAEVAQMKQVILKITQTLNITENGNGILSDPPSVITPHVPQNSPIKLQVQDYLSQQRLSLEENYSKPQIITESDDLGKLTTILESLRSVISPLEFDVLRLGRRVLPEHLVIQTATHQFAVGFLHQGGTRFYHRIRNWNELVINHPEIQFNLCRESRESLITAKKSAEFLEQFRNAENGNFVFMDKEQRIIFELIYQMIVDIQNKDLEVNLVEALDIVLFDYRNYWLFKNLTLLTLHQSNFQPQFSQT
ncbi:exonuclease family protein [Lyngbya aestuarii BL J]|uniref:Exonuclease family protein n=1 Tax=Lyngbya aestuarii BL J TaxID=1348334 RepID=U7QNJ6_9CYAN|nr:3'-5' exonuclease [Lyngbya aestuarii]ERT09428.1 exonuclease family protein [Lyngbya aestuarii BL J]